MKKTISSLNEKAWYRLLKTFYLFAFLASILIVIAYYWSENIPEREVVDREETEIICKYGTKDILKLNNTNAYFGTYSIKNKNIDSFEEEKINKICKIIKHNVELFEKGSFIKSNDKLFNEKAGIQDFTFEEWKILVDNPEQLKLRNEENKKMLNKKLEEEGKVIDENGNILDKKIYEEKINNQNNRKQKGILVSNNYFDVDFVFKNEGGFLIFLGYSILTILGIILFFEIIKRTFYYVVLGSINPEK